MYSFHQGPGQFAYSASGDNARALQAFFRDSLGPERRWFRDHPKANRYARPLTKAECDKIGYPEGSELVGHRLSTGQIAWFVYRPVVGDEESPEAIAAAVAESPAIGKTAGEAAVSSAPKTSAPRTWLVPSRTTSVWDSRFFF